MHILSADIGGTNSRFALFSLNEHKLSLLQSHNITNALISDFNQLLNEVKDYFISCDLNKLKYCAIAVAGQVINENTAICPNISWQINLKTSSFLPKKTLLINDFFALAWASQNNNILDLLTIQANNTIIDAPKAFIGAGTGLGTCLFLSQEKRALSSENGHTLFAFTPDEFDYANFLTKKLNTKQITLDMILSGRGLECLYQFHHKKAYQAKEIMQFLCEDDIVFKDFSKFLARACRHFALTSLCFGGLYIASGLVQRLPRLAQSEIFINEFTNSQTYREILRKMPIFLVRNSHAALYGAVYYILSQHKIEYIV